MILLHGLNQYLCKYNTQKKKGAYAGTKSQVAFLIFAKG